MEEVSWFGCMQKESLHMFSITALIQMGERPIAESIYKARKHWFLFQAGKMKTSMMIKPSTNTYQVPTMCQVLL